MTAMVLHLLVCAGLAAATPEDALREASARFERGDAAGAADAYETALQQGSRSADVYYNLGTAALRAGDTGRAVWALLEARARAPLDGDVLFNLDLARKANPDTVVGTVEGAWDAALHRVPRGPLQALAMASWWLLCALLVWRGVRGPGARLNAWLVRVGAWVVLVVAVLGLVEATAGAPTAVIMGKEVVVRATESVAGPEAFRVHAGLAVQPVEDVAGGMTRIRLANGLEGFVETQLLRRVGG
jgi:hypothetical protein